MEEFGRIGNLSNAVETFLELPVNIFDYGSGISSIKSKTAFLELKVFTCDNFNDSLVDFVKEFKKVESDAFHLVINDSCNPSISTHKQNSGIISGFMA